jgi:spore germination cell wall hydrolase CwlJ-like protein
MLTKNNIILIFTGLFFLVVMAFTPSSSIIESTEPDNIVQNTSNNSSIIKAVNTKHIQCLATGIYHEASSEPFLGQIAVARVIMNRVTHGFGSDPCKVVYQVTERDDRKICQFSWVCDEYLPPIANSAAYKQSMEIAKLVLTENKWSELIPNNVLFFHNLTVQPRWVYKRVMTIGNHVFYSRGGEKKSPSTDQ